MCGAEPLFDHAQTYICPNGHTNIRRVYYGEPLAHKGLVLNAVARKTGIATEKLQNVLELQQFTYYYLPVFKGMCDIHASVNCVVTHSNPKDPSYPGDKVFLPGWEFAQGERFEWSHSMTRPRLGNAFVDQAFNEEMMSIPMASVTGFEIPLDHSVQLPINLSPDLGGVGHLVNDFVGEQFSISASRSGWLHVQTTTSTVVTREQERYVLEHLLYCEINGAISSGGGSEPISMALDCLTNTVIGITQQSVEKLRRVVAKRSYLPWQIGVGLLLIGGLLLMDVIK